MLIINFIINSISFTFLRFSSSHLETEQRLHSLFILHQTTQKSAKNAPKIHAIEEFSMPPFWMNSRCPKALQTLKILEDIQLKTVKFS